MFRLVILLPILALMISLPCHTSDAPAPVSIAEIRSAIEKSLPFIERKGTAWMESRDCISCHHVGFMIWAHNDARAKGFAVDSKKIDDWTQWSVGKSLAASGWYKLNEKSIENLAMSCTSDDVIKKLKPIVGKPFIEEEDFLIGLEKVLTADELDSSRYTLVDAAKQKNSGGGNDGAGIFAVSSMLSGCATDGPRMSEWIKAVPVVMEHWQEKDGTLQALGQFPSQNRPIAEADVVTTAWCALGLANQYAKPNAATQKLLDKAVAKVRATKPGKSSESYVVGFLIERKFGSKERAGTLLDELIKQQNADGGWAWLTGASSDAFATGQALYALGYDGRTAEDPAVQRGLRYLLQTQDADGGWIIPALAIEDPKSKPERMKSVEKIYRLWGSVWAALGMLRTLPDK